MAPRQRSRDLGQMLRMLVGMPFEERRFGQTETLGMFFSMPDKRAATMMRPTAEAKLALREDRNLTPTESQLAILADYPEHKREWLLGIHERVMGQVGERERMRDIEISQRAAERLEKDDRERLMASMEKVVGPMPTPGPNERRIGHAA